MPASYTHQSIALKAAARVGLSPVPAYLAGSEGPDPLFFSFMNPRPSTAPIAGTMMHRTHTGAFLCALLESADSPLRQMYLMGFLSHYAADTVFHPFVYAHSIVNDAVSGNLHCQLEHAYELARYRMDGHPGGRPEQMAGFARLTSEELEDLAAFFASSMQRVYADQALPAPRIRRAFSDGVRLCRLLSSKSGAKYRLFTALPAGVGALARAHMIPPEEPSADLFNRVHQPWRSLWEPDRIRTESMDDLVAPAVDRSVSLIKAAQACLIHSDPGGFLGCTGDLSYDSGLDWRTTKPADQAFLLLHSDKRG